MGGIVYVLALGLLHLSLGHEAFLGGCPKVEPLENVDIEKLEGLWYVVEIFEKDVKCMTWTFAKDEKDAWNIYENRQSGLLYNVGLDSPSITSGKLKPKETPGAFVVSWPLNIGGSYDLTVFYADYDNVVGIFACQGLLIGHRQQGLILSRTPILRSMYRQLVKGALEKSKVETYYFHRVKQDRCGYEGQQDSERTDFGPLGSGPVSELEEEKEEEDAEGFGQLFDEYE